MYDSPDNVKGKKANTTETNYEIVQSGSKDHTISL